jgi:NAD(P)H-dependent flavin oxidoreductase YrpB (nitropropane dioxygenase family)
MSWVEHSRRVAEVTVDGGYTAYVPGALGNMNSPAMMEWVRTTDEKTGEPVVVVQWRTRRYDSSYQTLVIPMAEFRKIAERLGY